MPSSYCNESVSQDDHTYCKINDINSTIVPVNLDNKLLFLDFFIFHTFVVFAPRSRCVLFVLNLGALRFEGSYLPERTGHIPLGWRLSDVIHLLSTFFLHSSFFSSPIRFQLLV